MTSFPLISPIQMIRLFDVIKTDTDKIKWTADEYQLKGFTVDKNGWVYTIQFTFNNGWLTVVADHRMGGYDKYIWDQEGESVIC